MCGFLLFKDNRESLVREEATQKQSVIVGPMMIGAFARKKATLEELLTERRCINHPKSICRRGGPFKPSAGL
jgi:hypothetical protein